MRFFGAFFRFVFLFAFLVFVLFFFEFSVRFGRFLVESVLLERSVRVVQGSVYNYVSVYCVLFLVLDPKATQTLKWYL